MYECEKAKISLSTQSSAKISIPKLVDGHDFSITIDREKFETLSDDLLDTMNECIEDVLDDG